MNKLIFSLGIVLLLLNPIPSFAQSFDRSLLSGLWAESVNTKPVCSADNLHQRFELDRDGKTLTFLLDRKWKTMTGGVVDRYSAAVVKNTERTLVIRYNREGTASANYPLEWELAFVAPGVYRWRATEWPEGKVNGVVGIRCKE